MGGEWGGGGGGDSSSDLRDKECVCGAGGKTEQIKMYICLLIGRKMGLNLPLLQGVKINQVAVSCKKKKASLPVVM